MEETDFSAKELLFLQDIDFLSTKAGILEKVKMMLARVEQKLHHHISGPGYHFPPNALAKSGKISKGENYKLLPYLILDYPRLFSRESVFSFRTMFWWGNFFSCTLHLQGEALEQCRQLLIENSPLLVQRRIFFCINNSPWIYDYCNTNYILAGDLPREVLQELIENKSFIKLSRFIPLDAYDKLEAFSEETFHLFMKIGLGK